MVDASTASVIANSRIASVVHYSIFTIDLPLGDGNVYEVAIYCADWDSGGVRAQKIDVLDSASGAILDTRAMSKFVRGEYLV